MGNTVSRWQSSSSSCFVSPSGIHVSLRLLGDLQRTGEWSVRRRRQHLLIENGTFFLLLLLSFLCVFHFGNLGLGKGRRCPRLKAVLLYIFLWRLGRMARMHTHTHTRRHMHCLMNDWPRELGHPLCAISYIGHSVVSFFLLYIHIFQFHFTDSSSIQVKGGGM